MTDDLCHLLPIFMSFLSLSLVRVCVCVVYLHLIFLLTISLEWKRKCLMKKKKKGPVVRELGPTNCVIAMSLKVFICQIRLMAFTKYLPENWCEDKILYLTGVET